MQTLTGFTWPYRGKGAEWEEQREQKIWNDTICYVLVTTYNDDSQCMSQQFHQIHIKLRILPPGLHQSLYLSTASTVMLPTDDSERSLAGNAGVAGFIRHPVWRVCTEPTRNALTQSRPVTSHQYICCRGKEQADISAKLWVGLFVDLLTFELALPRLGCQFRWRNGLLAESTVLQHCTTQNRTYWRPQKKT